MLQRFRIQAFCIHATYSTTILSVDGRASAEPRPPREPDRAAQVRAAPSPGAVRAAAGAERRRDAEEAGGGLGQARPMPHANPRARGKGQKVIGSISQISHTGHSITTFHLGAYWRKSIRS